MKTKSLNKKTGITLVALGLLALISAGALQIHNLTEEANAAKSSEYIAEILVEKIAQNKEKSVNTDTVIEKDEEPPIESDTESETNDSSIEIEGEKYIGILSIAALQLKWPVNSEWSYQKLKTSPCRYSGNAEDNTLTIAAHNYRYHFAEFTKLQVGDKVVFTDTQGKIYRYYVEEIETIEPTRIDKVTKSSFDLTLFTCNYSGDARIVVKCNLINKKLP